MAGILSAAVLTVLITLGSRGFHWFDAALIGYAVATIFATATLTGEVVQVSMGFSG